MRPWYRYTQQTDDAPQRRFITPFSKVWGFGAPVTIGLIALNCLIWLVMIVLWTINGGSKPQGMMFLLKMYDALALTPDNVMEKYRVYQLVTSVFMHDLQNILHLFFNMYLLWIFGPRVERTFGSKRYLAFYLVCGVAGSIVSLLMRLMTGDTDIPSLGASAAIFGMLVAYGFLFANDILLLFFAFPVKAWKAVVGFIVLETLFILLGAMQGVDHWAHLGGAAAAAVWMLLLIRSRGHKTAHNWHHGATTSTPGFTSGRTGKSRNQPNFKIVFKKPPDPDEHPEGTDDDPPPEWFKID